MCFEGENFIWMLRYRNEGSTTLICTLISKNAASPAQACILKVTLSAFLELAKYMLNVFLLLKPCDYNNIMLSTNYVVNCT